MPHLSRFDKHVPASNGRWYKVGHDAYFVADHTKPESLPVPNCDENITWWELQADQDLERCIGWLVRLTKLGVKWADDLACRLIDMFA